jgi:hypothetical protein
MYQCFFFLNDVTILLTLIKKKVENTCMGRIFRWVSKFESHANESHILKKMRIGSQILKFIISATQRCATNHSQREKAAHLHVRRRRVGAAAPAPAAFMALPPPLLSRKEFQASEAYSSRIPPQP